VKKFILTLSIVLGIAGSASAQPNLRWKVEELAAQYPAEFACAHARPQRDCNWDFSFIVAIELNKLDPSIGANRKRGNGDFSEDALAILHPAGTTVDINGQPSFVIDYIACAGGDPGVCSPSVYWASVGGVSGWVDPKTLKDPRGKSTAPPVDAGWTLAHAAILAQAPSFATAQQVAEQLAFSFPGERWGLKSADPSRPVSEDVIARQFADGRLVGYRVIPPTLQPQVFDRGATLHPGDGGEPPRDHPGANP
jgi:hypothetical protein